MFKKSVQTWLALVVTVLLCANGMQPGFSFAQEALQETAQTSATQTITAEAEQTLQPAPVAEPAAEDGSASTSEAPPEESAAATTDETASESSAGTETELDTTSPEVSDVPTAEPTVTVTQEPTETVSAEPTAEASAEPSEEPSVEPSESPTIEPTPTIEVNAPLLVTELQLTLETPMPLPGQQAQLTVTVLPEGAWTPEITFTSSDELIATVNAQGLVTVLAAGEVTLTATATYSDEQLAQAQTQWEAARDALAEAEALQALSTQADSEGETAAASSGEGDASGETATQADNGTQADAVTADLPLEPALFEPITAELKLTVGYPFAGLGTEESPFTIGTADELALLAELVNTGVQPYAAAVYLLVDDLRLPNREWIAIGTEMYPFTGSFDGSSYKIYSLQRHAGDASEGAYGLFGVTQGATLIRIALEDADFNISASADTDVGLIVGRMNGGSLSRCYTTGTVETHLSGNGATGGLVGRVNGGQVTDCFSLAGITANDVAGVLVGVMEGNADLTSSYSRSEPIIADVTETVGEETGGADVQAFVLEGEAESAQALTFSEGVEQTSYQGFDFGDVWELNTSMDADYPFPVLADNPYTGAATYGADVVDVEGLGLLAVSTSIGDPSASRVDNLLGSEESYFSLKDSLPVVRDQGAYGTCWTFATVAALESNAINKGYASAGSVNLAELSVMWFTNMGARTSSGTYNDPLNNFGGDRTRYTASAAMSQYGGSPLYAMYNIASWMVPAQEDGTTAYTSGNISSIQSSGLSYSYAFNNGAPVHVKGVYIASMDNRDSVKALIKTYGAVASQYYTPSDGSGYSTCGAFFHSAALTGNANHAIAIVGWNDNYSKNNFAVGNQPSSDGAWLVRNSWGPDWMSAWGLDGYFWASYEDYHFCSSNGFALAFDTESAGAYDYCYQYDGGNRYASAISGGSSVLMGANVFTAQHDEQVEAVSFWSDTQSNMSYTVQVYQLGAGDSPSGGTLVATETGTTSYEGYYTRKLTTPVPLQTGDRFSVVLTMNSGSGTAYLSADRSGSNSWLQFYSYSTAGQSYVKTASASSWTDLVNAGLTNYNLRIKAFTSDGPAPDTITVTAPDDATTVPKNSTLQLSTTVEPYGSSRGVNWSVVSAGGEASCVNGLVTGLAMGEVSVVAASVRDGGVTGSLTLQVINPLAKSGQILLDGSAVTSAAVDMSSGSATNFTALLTANDTDAPLQDVGWSIGDSTVVSMEAQPDGSVNITPLKLGSTTLTATATDGSNVTTTITLTCLKSVTDVVINGQTDMTGNTWQKLTATVLPSDATNPAFTWSWLQQPDFPVLFYPGTGQLYVNNPSELKTITLVATSVSNPEVQGTLTILVHPRVIELGVQDESGTLITRGTLPVSTTSEGVRVRAVVIRPTSGASGKVVWTSSNGAILSFETTENEGEIVIHPRTTGFAYLIARATDGSNAYTYISVQVKKMVTSVAISGPGVVAYGRSISLTATALPTDATSRGVIWSVSNDGDKQLFTINSWGVLYARYAGEGVQAHVTATAADGSGQSATYTVTQYATAAKAVALYPGEATTPSNGTRVMVETGAYRTTPFVLRAAVTPSAAAQQVVWRLSTTQYLHVESQSDNTLSLTPVANGITYIYATAADGSMCWGYVALQTYTAATGITLSGPAKVAAGLYGWYSATLTADNGLPVSQNGVVWSLDAGSNTQAYFSGNLLVVRRGTLSEPKSVIVRATAKDGSGTTATRTVALMDAPANGVTITDSGTGETISRGTTRNFDMTAGSALEFVGTATGPSGAIVSDEVSWMCSNTYYASIETDGNRVRITPKVPGSIFLKATATDGGGAYQYFYLRIYRGISGLTVSAPAEIATGRYTIPTVAFTPADATTRRVTWSFVNPEESAYAVLYAYNGMMVANTAGIGHTLHLIATAADGSGVVSDPVAINILPATTALTLYSGSTRVSQTTQQLNLVSAETGSPESMEITLEVTPSDASHRVTWANSAPSVVSLTPTDTGAVITALKAGTARIIVTAQDGTFRSSYLYVTVSKLANDILFNAPKNVAVGKVVSLAASLLPTGVQYNSAYWWLSADDGSKNRGYLASYGLSAQVFAAYNSLGTTLTVECMSMDRHVQRELTLHVTALPTSLIIRNAASAEVTGQMLTLSNGASLTLTAAASEGASQDFSWGTLQSKILSCSVDASGVCTVTRLAAGIATVVVYATDGSGMKKYVYFN